MFARPLALPFSLRATVGNGAPVAGASEVSKVGTGATQVRPETLSRDILSCRQIGTALGRSSDAAHRPSRWLGGDWDWFPVQALLIIYVVGFFLLSLIEIY